MFKIRPITNVLGLLLMFQAGLMLSCLLFAEGDESRTLLLSAAITMGVGLLLFFYRIGSTTITKREGYLIVALGWIVMVGFGTLPYLLSGITGSTIDAFFEAVSGYTTTGATIFNDVESLPRGLLFWRSLTQWIGGMGIIVLTVAIFPLLGIGGVELFVAEAPGPTSDKIHPRIKVTARRLWLIYVSLTAILIALYKQFGMSFYDAVNHGLTTMATGGFSTKNASMAHFGPSIQYLAILFMLLAGTNYTVIYFGLTGKFRRVWRSDEFRAYVTIVLLMGLAVAGLLIAHDIYAVEPALRNSLFQIVSVITTTGYVTADYTAWGLGFAMFFFILLFCGACAGSTSGGIKLVRHIVFVKNSILEFKRILHPRAIIRIKINQEIVAPRILTHILVFLLVYLGIFVVGTIVVSACGMDFTSASGAVATSLGNVGPAIGSVGPVNTFAHVPDMAKAFLGFIMLLGRLELFTILVLFTPYFWKKSG
ncbi:MAG: TrkH family potassium uptake protein [Saprospiraceae bacterium]|nr:TrkH family potassium uptake protein [Saprospiraceae bacterium]